MRTMALIIAAACMAAGCSSEPVKNQSTAVETSSTAPPALKAEAKPRVGVQYPEQPRVAVGPRDNSEGIPAKRSVYYDFDNPDIRDEYKPLIRAHAGYLSAHPASKAKIEGNCDERGSREYNLALGQRRAEGVKTMLKLLGASDAQVETVSWGEEKPKAAGHEESAWTENRRSDISYEKSR